MTFLGGGEPRLVRRGQNREFSPQKAISNQITAIFRPFLVFWASKRRRTAFGGRFWRPGRCFCDFWGSDEPQVPSHGAARRNIRFACADRGIGFSVAGLGEAGHGRNSPTPWRGKTGPSGAGYNKSGNDSGREQAVGAKSGIFASKTHPNP